MYSSSGELSGKGFLLAESRQLLLGFFSGVALFGILGLAVPVEVAALCGAAPPAPPALVVGGSLLTPPFFGGGLFNAPTGTSSRHSLLEAELAQSSKSPHSISPSRTLSSAASSSALGIEFESCFFACRAPTERGAFTTRGVTPPPLRKRDECRRDSATIATTSIATHRRGEVDTMLIYEGTRSTHGQLHEPHSAT